jgi:hypothetical protein
MGQAAYARLRNCGEMALLNMDTDSKVDQDVISLPNKSPEQGSEAKEWKRFEPAEYHEAVGKLIHFSSKTVNSNAMASGIRLAKGTALDLPYVAARTLMSAGVKLSLDYLEGGATQAGKMKQINAVLGNSEFAQGASPEEREAILGAVSQAEQSGYGTGLSVVDSRLRQVLIPKDDSSNGYVAVTPITAGGVCDYLFNSETGLVKRHNAEAKEERNSGTSERRAIKQAQFGIGGANPQNVGCLVRSMTRPLFVRGPLSDGSIKRAFALFYRGVSLNVSRRSLLWEQLDQYRALRSRIAEANSPFSPMEMRSQEEQLVRSIVESVLSLGADALGCLRLPEHALPREQMFPSEDGEYELLSRSVPGVVRGLIDSRLRDVDYKGCSQGRQMDWPREAAELIVSRIATAKHLIEGELVSLIPLDRLGRNSLVSMMEDMLS